MLSKSITSGKYFWHGDEITETEYNKIKSIIDNRPVAPDGYAYRLTADLQWELFELPVMEEEEELTAEEALAELMEVLAE